MSTSTSFAMSALRSALPRAGPSKCRMPAASAARLSARFASTSTESTSTSSTYPFSSTVHIPPPSLSTSTPPAPNLLHPKNGASLIDHINNTFRQTTLDPSSHLTNLFSRRHPQRIKTGSILTVISYTNSTKTSTTPFSGVLMGIRRRGVDSSFVLRNIINKVGVESSFKIYSPMIKEIKVVKRAETVVGSEKRSGGLKDLRRAKVGYLREKAGLMERIAGALKAGQPQAGRRR